MISDAFGQTFRRNAQIRQQRKCAWSGLWCLHEWSHFRSNGPFDGRSYLFVSTNLCILMQHLTSFPEGRCQPERVTLRRGLMITGNAFWVFFKCKTALKQKVKDKIFAFCTVVEYHLKMSRFLIFIPKIIFKYLNFYIVWKLLKMSHLNFFLFWHFPPIFVL